MDGVLESDRDRHLFGAGNKCILALDGGGVRAIIAAAFLKQIEKVLSVHMRGAVKLSDYFDLIGGTSTGATIAAALALGGRAIKVDEFLRVLIPKTFKLSLLQLARLKPKFVAEALREEITRLVGDRALDNPDITTGLCIIAKRLDTGSPWIITNNPHAPYWETKTDDGGYLGNRHYPLANLVRASMGAPFYFEPEWLEIVAGERPGLFVDGGLTPYNNPSLALFMLATLPPYGLRWQLGSDHLAIVSIGAGRIRDRSSPEELGRAAGFYRSLSSFFRDPQDFVLRHMQYHGECPMPWPIDDQVGTLADDSPPGGKQFRFVRYDIEIERDWISGNLGQRLSERDIQRLSAVDDPAIVEDLSSLATMAAEKQVKAEHFLSKDAS